MWQQGKWTLDCFLVCSLWTIFASLSGVWNKGTGPLGIAVLTQDKNCISFGKLWVILKLIFWYYLILLRVNVSVITMYQSCDKHMWLHPSNSTYRFVCYASFTKKQKLVNGDLGFELVVSHSTQGFLLLFLSSNHYDYEIVWLQRSTLNRLRRVCGANRVSEQKRGL